MAAEPIGAISVALTADLGPLVAGFNAAGKSTEQFANRAGQHAQKADSAIGKLTLLIQQRAESSASSLGLTGSALRALGPAGFAAGATLGGLYLAFQRVLEGAKAFRESARQIQEVSTQVDLSTSAFQALRDVAEDNGVSQERYNTGISKFAAELANARKGGGEFYAELKRINGGLAESFASASNTEDAIAILADGFKGLDKATQQYLAKLAFGKGGGGFATTLLDLAGRGGFGAVIEAGQKAGKVIDEEIIAKQAAAGVAAARMARLIEQETNRGYAGIAAGWKDLKAQLGITKQNELDVAVKFRVAVESGNVGTAAELGAGGLLNALTAMPGPVGDLMRAVVAGRRALTPPAAVGGVAPGAQAGLSELGKPQATPQSRINEAFEVSDQAARIQQINALTRQIADEKARLAVLGDVATAEERASVRTKELALARLQHTNITKADTDAIDENARIHEAAAVLAKRVQLGIATDTEILSVRTRQLAQDEAQGVIKSEEEKRTARRLSFKEAQEQFDQLKIRSSETPELTRLAIDSANLTKTLDSELAGALRGSTSDLIAMAKGTETLGQGLTNLSTRLLESVAHALLLKTVVGPIAGGISGAFTGFSGFSGFGASGASGSVSGAATGSAGVSHSGGMAGESTRRRSVPTSTFSNAIRLHTGLTSREFPTILEKGERVLTAAMDNRASRTIAGLSSAVGSGKGGDMEVHIHEAPGGDKASVKKSQGPNGARLDIQMKRTVEEIMEQSIRAPGGRGRKAIADSFAMNGATGLAG
jgi:hypothetical protein